MFSFDAESPDLLPVYKTKYSAGADVCAKQTVVLQPREVKLVGTGVWIKDCDFLEAFAEEGVIPELQLRLRSSLGKKGIFLANGVGTIDADYRDEILVPLWNSTDSPIVLPAKTAVAQLVANLVERLDADVHNTDRSGGFGSTDGVLQ
jgi:dUTP pyrophosphatase